MAGNLMEKFKSQLQRQLIEHKEKLVETNQPPQKTQRLFCFTQNSHELSGLDTILNEPPSDYALKNFPIQIPGFDKDGDLVAIIPFGRWDLHGVVEKGREEEFIYFIHYVLELAWQLALFRCSCSKNKMAGKINLIVDHQGISLKSFLYKPMTGLLHKILTILSCEYPGRLKIGYFINCTKPIQLFWTLVSPLLTQKFMCKIYSIQTQKTMMKMHVFGPDSQIWRDKLLLNITPENLPLNYGGTYQSVPELFCYYPLVAISLIWRQQQFNFLDNFTCKILQDFIQISFTLQNKNGHNIFVLP